MLHHVSVGVTDVARAGRFYDAVLKALGYKRVADYSPGAIAYGESKDRPEFWVGLPHNQGLPSVGNGTHVGFVAKTKAAVNKFHDEALKAGGSNGGEPGPRPDYGPAYYGAFIYDLDGKNCGRFADWYRGFKLDIKREGNGDDECLGDLVFADSREAVPLQAADLLAYEGQRYKRKSNGDPDAPIRTEYMRALRRFKSQDDFWLFDEPRLRNLENKLDADVKRTTAGA